MKSTYSMYNDLEKSDSDTYIYDPYNSLNKEITENEIRQILDKYGIHSPIHNIHLYKRAFVHQSYVRRLQR